MSPVRYELDFYIPEDDILHRHRRENLKSCTSLSSPRERDHYASRQFDSISKDLFKLHLRLAKSLAAEDWDLIERIRLRNF
jgi:hypothetical protein